MTNILKGEFLTFSVFKPFLSRLITSYKIVKDILRDIVKKLVVIYI